jgi:thioesterase domain-containing protein
MGYAALARYLGEDQPVYGLTALDVGEEVSSLSSLEAMAACYTNVIQSKQSHGPYYLGGYLFGGTLAFEMAQQLRAQGEKIALLAMLDQPAPKSGYESPRINMTFIRGFAGNLLYWVRDFRSITRREQRGRIRRKLRLRRNGTPDGELDLSLYVDDVNRVPQQYRELVRKHLLALVAYQPKPYDGRVTLFRAPRQPLICTFDPHQAWDHLAKGGVEVYPIAGTHRNLLEEPHVQVLAAAIKEALAAASARAD